MNSVQLSMTTLPESESVEEQFASLAAHAKDASESASKLSKLLRRLEASLQDGDVGAAMKTSLELRVAGGTLSKLIDSATSISESKIASGFNSGRFFDEVIRAANAIGLSGLRSTEGVLFSYPFTVERGKSLTLKIGKKTVRSIRPKAVAEKLSDARARSSNLNRPEFLASLEQGFLLVSSKTGRELVSVGDLYDTLTLLPGTRKEYTFFDFLVHLNEIDRMGPHVTVSGRKVSFPASTATRGGKAERLVTRDGREVLYTAVRFQRVTVDRSS